MAKGKSGAKKRNNAKRKTSQTANNNNSNNEHNEQESPSDQTVSVSTNPPAEAASQKVEDSAESSPIETDHIVDQLDSAAVAPMSDLARDHTLEAHKDVTQMLNTNHPIEQEPAMQDVPDAQSSSHLEPVSNIDKELVSSDSAWVEQQTSDEQVATVELTTSVEGAVVSQTDDLFAVSNEDFVINAPTEESQVYSEHAAQHTAAQEPWTYTENVAIQRSVDGESPSRQIEKAPIPTAGHLGSIPVDTSLDATFTPIETVHEQAEDDTADREDPPQPVQSPLPWEEDRHSDPFASTSGEGFPWDSTTLSLKGEETVSKLAQLTFEDDVVDKPMEETTESEPQPNSSLFTDDTQEEFSALIGVNPAPQEDFAASISSSQASSEKNKEVLSNKFFALDFAMDDELLEDELLEDELLDDDLLPEEPVESPPVVQAKHQSQAPKSPLPNVYKLQSPALPQIGFQTQSSHHHNYAPSPGLQPPQPAHHVDLSKLNKTKMKSDAYDFPMDLLPKKQVQRPHLVGSAQPSFQQPTAFTGSVGGSSNVGQPSPSMSTALGSVQNVPRTPYAPAGPPALASPMGAANAGRPPQALKKKQSSFFEELPMPVVAPHRVRRTSAMSSAVSSPGLKNPTLHPGFAAPPVPQVNGQYGNMGTPSRLNTSQTSSASSKYSAPPPPMTAGPSNFLRDVTSGSQQPHIPQKYAPQQQANPPVNQYAPQHQGPPVNQYASQQKAIPSVNQYGQQPQSGLPQGLPYSQVPAIQYSVAASNSPKASKYAPSLSATQTVHAPGISGPGIADLPFGNRPSPLLSAAVNVPYGSQPQNAHQVTSAHLNGRSISTETHANKSGGRGVHSGLLSPSSAVSQNAVKYAPINHKRQASSSAVQYDPLLSGMSQKHQPSQPPTVPQQPVYAPPGQSQLPVNGAQFQQSHMRPPQTQVYGVPTQGGFLQQAQHGQPSARQTVSAVVSNPELLRSRQFPLFSWGNGVTLAYWVPNIGYGYNTGIKLVKSDYILQESMLKEFPQKKTTASLLRYLESLIAKLESNRISVADDEELLLAQLLKHKFTDPLVPFNLGGVINITDQNLDSVQQRRNDTLSKRHVLSLLAAGQKETVLQLAITHKDFALALLVSGLMGMEKWLTVSENYLAQEFQGDKDHFFPTLVKILSGDINAVIASFRADPVKGQWACSNWKEIATAVVSNNPPTLAHFLSFFGEFLVEHGKVIPAYILFVIGDIPLSAFGAFNSLKATLYAETYAQYLQYKGVPSVLPHLLLQHANYLADYNILSEAQRYSDQAFAMYRASKRHDPSFVYSSKRLTQKLVSTAANDGWFAKPKLDRVWGTLDKGLNKLISGDELPSETKDSGVFSKFNSDLSRTSSFVSLPNTSGSEAVHPRSSMLHSTPFMPTAAHVTENGTVNVAHRLSTHTAFAADHSRPYVPSNSAIGQASARSTPISSANAYFGGVRPDLPSSDLYSASFDQSPKKPLRYAPVTVDDNLSLNRTSSFDSHTSHDEFFLKGNNGQQLRYEQQPKQSVAIPVNGAEHHQGMSQAGTDPQRNSQKSTSPVGLPAAGPLTVDAKTGPPKSGLPKTSIPSCVPEVVPEVTQPYAPSLLQMGPEDSSASISKPSVPTHPITSTAGESSFATDSTLQHHGSAIGNSSGTFAPVQEPSTAVTEAVTSEYTAQATQDDSRDADNEYSQVQDDDYFSNQSQSEYGSVNAIPYVNKPLLGQEDAEDTTQKQMAVPTLLPVSAHGSDPDLTELAFANQSVVDDGIKVEQPNADPALVEQVALAEEDHEVRPPSPIASPPVNPYAPSAPLSRKPISKKLSRFTPASYTPVSSEQSATASPVVADEVDFYSISGVQQHNANQPASVDTTPVNRYAPAGPSPIHPQNSNTSASKHSSYAPGITSPDSGRPSEQSNFAPYGQESGADSLTIGAPTRMQDSNFVSQSPSGSSTMSMSYEPPSARITAYEPPTTKNGQINEEEEYYDDVVDDEEDEEDEEDGDEDPRVKKSDRPSRKPSVKKRKADAGSGRWLGGWFRGKENKNEPKVYKANLGQQSTFHYDEKLKRWVNADMDPEELQKQAAPPPPPVIKKKPESIVKPRSDSLIEGGTPSPAGSNATLSMLRVPSGPSPGSGATPPGPPGNGPPGPKKPSLAMASDLDSLIGLSGGTSKRKKKTRGYVNEL